MSWPRLMLPLVLWSGVVQESPSPQDERFQAVFEDLRHRNPDLHAAIQRMLEEDPARACQMLARHESYLRELESAQAENPRMFQVMQQQEAIQQKLGPVLERRHRLAQRGKDVTEIENELRGLLEEWFEVRQLLRALQLEQFEGMLARQRAEFASFGHEPAHVLARWERFLHRSTDPWLGTDLEVVGPRVVEFVMQRNPEAGQTLARLFADSRAQFEQAMRELLSEEPVILEEVLRSLPEEEAQLHDWLRSAVDFVRQVLANAEDQAGGEAVSLEENEELQHALRELAEAELAVAQVRLDQVERQFEERRETLRFREENRGLIVDLKMADLTGRRDRYEW